MSDYSSIKVYEVSGDTRPLNTISVWDASSSGTRPLNSIPVWKDTNVGDRPLNSIQVKLVDKALNAIPVWFNAGSEPGPGPQPGPTWDETKIGDQTWSTENLAYDDGGEGILIVPDFTVNGVNFGTQYFYRGDAALRIKNDPIISGWHIPTQEDCELLLNNLDNDCDSIRTTSGWNDGMNGNDLYGMHLAPLGDYYDDPEDEEEGQFWSQGDEAIFWIDYEVDDNYLDACMEVYSDNGAYVPSYDWWHTYFPIRLVKD